MKRKLSFVLLFIHIICSCISPVYTLADEKKPESIKNEYSLHAEHALVCDINAYFEIYSKKADISINPYSYTKILTAATVMDIEKDLDKMVTVPEGILKDYDYSYGNIGLASGEKISIINLMTAMIIQDAGDCALALAHTVGDSYKDFIKAMNNTAAKAGAKSSVFSEPAGFDDSKQKTTLSDMAKITAYALKNEAFAKIAKTSRFEIPSSNKRNSPRTIYSKNAFLSRFYSEDYYDERITGVIGYYADESNTGIIARYQSGGDDLLILTAKSDDNEFANYAYPDTLELAKKGKDYFTRKTIIKKEEFVSEIKLSTSKNTDRALLVSLGEISVKIPKNFNTELLTREISLRDNIDAPLGKFEELGEIKIYYDGTLIGKAPVASYHKIEKSTVKLMKNILIDMMCTLYFWIVLLVILLIIYIIKKTKNKT